MFYRWYSYTIIVSVIINTGWNGNVYTYIWPMHIYRYAPKWLVSQHFNMASYKIIEFDTLTCVENLFNPQICSKQLIPSRPVKNSLVRYDWNIGFVVLQLWLIPDNWWKRLCYSTATKVRLQAQCLMKLSLFTFHGLATRETSTKQNTSR